MARIPNQVASFLDGKSFAVAGASREKASAANAIFQKLKRSGYTVFPVNPNATAVLGETCYPDLNSLPQKVDGVVIATHPKVAVDIVRQCAEAGIAKVWFHRSFGDGSVSNEAVEEARKLGIEPLVGGCPLMYCAPVDFGHRCMRWILNLQHRVPA